MSRSAFSGTTTVALSRIQSPGRVVPVQSHAENRPPSEVLPHSPIPTTLCDDAPTCFTQTEYSTRIPRILPISSLETMWPSVWLTCAVLPSLRCNEDSPLCFCPCERLISVNGSSGRVQRQDVAVGLPESPSNDSNAPPS